MRTLDDQPALTHEAQTSEPHPKATGFSQPPSFTQALVTSVVGLVTALGLALVIAMIWQGISSTEEAARQEISETLNRTVERLGLLVRSAEMTAESAERAARWPEVTSGTLRSTLERSLAAFEQRPELSYLGIVLPDTGEYGNLERTASGEILLWLFPGTRPHDPVTRTYVLTDQGFVLRDERPTDGYDPRKRPFYQAALDGSPEGKWIPGYKWIVHEPDSPDLWGFSFVKALRSGEGRLVGVLDTDFDMPALNGFLQSLVSEYRSEIQIVELAAVPRLIGDNAVERAPLPLPDDLAPLIELSASGGPFVSRMELDGEHRWVAARRMELKGGLSWLVVASRKDPFIQAPLRLQLYQVVGMGLVMVAGLLLVSVWMARRFGQPLTELEQRIASTGHDEREVPVASAASVAGGFRETRLLGEALDRFATERRQAQARLEAFNAELEERVAHRTRELQIVNEELDSFSYSVSHDLRAPLRSIAGFSEILTRSYADALDGKARDYLNRVQAATHRMGELIDDLLKLSRVSRAEMRRETVDLSLMAHEILAQLRQDEPDRQVQTGVADGLIAEGDVRLLRILLENLLGNAWKFTSKTPDARIAFTAVNESGATTFVVSDNGAGFDMRYADKLFAPFQRLHRTTEFSGTGIGLATVQRIVGRHGGVISAEAEPGKGATFRFSL
ncbi:sensor histidine kinase [Hyphomicrobium sp.]|uniref:sensor histidine kinase n=1 Tax=Hyphomicrobium sp. TaxID=82 RepID=UPI0025C292DC|nr:sensor histidine kinase [Hyphomicrobium sp.]MCC7250493.1 hypothetical protein [Hyphomicrobium sp.]